MQKIMTMLKNIEVTERRIRKYKPADYTCGVGNIVKQVQELQFVIHQLRHQLRSPQPDKSCKATVVEEIFQGILKRQVQGYELFLKAPATNTMPPPLDVRNLEEKIQTIFSALPGNS